MGRGMYSKALKKYRRMHGLDKRQVTYQDAVKAVHPKRFDDDSSPTHTTQTYTARPSKQSTPARIVSKILGLSAKELLFWKWAIVFMIILDLFGVYYALGLKKLGAALLIVLIVAFAFVAFASSGKQKEIEKEEKKIAKEMKKGLDEFNNQIRVEFDSQI